MLGEASLLLKVKNKRSDFVLADLSYVRAYSSRVEKTLKISYTTDDYVNGIGALPFGSSTELVTMKQGSYIGAKI